MEDIRYQNPKYFRIIPVISIFVVLLIILVSRINRSLFQPYFGDLSPVLTAAIICISSWIAFYLLSNRYEFRIYRPDSIKKGSIRVFILCIPFMLAVSLADLILGFPEDMNVAFPLALLFYPAMGYIGQITLHVIPLLILILLSEVLREKVSQNTRILYCMIIAAGFEAVFQVGGMNAFHSLTSLDYFVILHLFLFGLAEFYIYRKYDYISMYLFRLIYYVYWHVLWAELRLDWLF